MKTAEEILKTEGIDFDDRGRNETDPVYLLNIKRAMYAYASQALDEAARKIKDENFEYDAHAQHHRSEILNIKSQLK